MRVRYWRLGITDVLEARYPIEKTNHWEIKCILGEYQQVGIFWFKYGTPYENEPVHGISFYYNEIPPKIVQELVNFLHAKFGGKVLYSQTRVFLNGSKEFADPKSIGILANELSLKFNAPVEISIEFEKVIEKEREQNTFNLPPSKALPIVGPD
ncbi:MAG: hypothetical protein WA421_04180 [Nitrososphaeraceae archaeon]|jgi:hypothetical protein